MSQRFDPKPLNAFFQEIEDQLKIKLRYAPEHPDFPIQLDNHPEGISRDKTNELLYFIKGQVDLRDNEIAKVHQVKHSTKMMIEISVKAAKALSEVYAMSLFFDPDEDEDQDKS